MARDFTELKIWQEAKELTVTTYRSLRYCKDYGFKDQIQRAAVSIMNNIAEGSEAGTDTQYIRYLTIAKGSCAEVKSMLILANDLDYLELIQQQSMLEKTTYISKGINKLINYLKEQQH